MKTKNFFITSICLMAGITNAMAAGSPCTQVVDCDSVTISGTANTLGACAGGTAGSRKCYRAEDGKYYSVIDCGACANYVSYGVSSTVCPNITYITCANCNCYSLCGGGWTSTGTAGYEKDLDTYMCNCSTNECVNNKKTYKYRCAAGYYGDPTRDGVGCTQCPTWSGVYTDYARTNLAVGTSLAGNNKAITSCRFTTGTTYYDVTGAFKLDSSCNYTN